MQRVYRIASLLHWLHRTDSGDNMSDYMWHRRRNRLHCQKESKEQGKDSTSQIDGQHQKGDTGHLPSIMFLLIIVLMLGGSVVMAINPTLNIETPDSCDNRDLNCYLERSGNSYGDVTRLSLKNFSVGDTIHQRLDLLPSRKQRSLPDPYKGVNVTPTPTPHICLSGREANGGKCDDPRYCLINNVMKANKLDLTFNRLLWFWPFNTVRSYKNEGEHHLSWFHHTIQINATQAGASGTINNVLQSRFRSNPTGFVTSLTNGANCASYLSQPPDTNDRATSAFGMAMGMAGVTNELLPVPTAWVSGLANQTPLQLLVKWEERCQLLQDAADNETAVEDMDELLDFTMVNTSSLPLWQRSYLWSSRVNHPIPRQILCGSCYTVPDRNGTLHWHYPIPSGPVCRRHLPDRIHPYWIAELNFTLSKVQHNGSSIKTFERRIWLLFERGIQSANERPPSAIILHSDRDEIDRSFSDYYIDVDKVELSPTWLRGNRSSGWWKPQTGPPIDGKRHGELVTCNGHIGDDSNPTDISEEVYPQMRLSNPWPQTLTSGWKARVPTATFISENSGHLPTGVANDKQPFLWFWVPSNETRTAEYQRFISSTTGGKLTYYALHHGSINPQDVMQKVCNDNGSDAISSAGLLRWLVTQHPQAAAGSFCKILTSLNNWARAEVNETVPLLRYLPEAIQEWHSNSVRLPRGWLTTIPIANGGTDFGILSETPFEGSGLGGGHGKIDLGMEVLISNILTSFGRLTDGFQPSFKSTVFSHLKLSTRDSSCTFAHKQTNLALVTPAICLRGDYFPPPNWSTFSNWMRLKITCQNPLKLTTPDSATTHTTTKIITWLQSLNPDTFDDNGCLQLDQDWGIKMNSTVSYRDWHQTYNYTDRLFSSFPSPDSPEPFCDMSLDVTKAFDPEKAKLINNIDVSVFNGLPLNPNTAPDDNSHHWISIADSQCVPLLCRAIHSVVDDFKTGVANVKTALDNVNVRTPCNYLRSLEALMARQYESLDHYCLGEILFIIIVCVVIFGLLVAFSSTLAAVIVLEKKYKAAHPPSLDNQSATKSNKKKKSKEPTKLD